MKTCYYELLGVSSTADDLELKKAFRRKALQYHPDKNRDNVEEATETFAQIRAAYEVLADPQERAWYDSHKSQILNDDINGGTYEDDVYGSYAMDTGVTSEELLMFFNSSLYTRVDDTPAGFYQIAGKVFARLAKDEILHGRISGLKEFNRYDDDFFESNISSHGYVKASNDRIKDMLRDDSRCLFPPFGNSTTDYEVLKKFYKKWSSFNTIKSFRWKDEYMYSSIYDRRTKREINKRNEKVRQQFRNEYNKTVKRFVTFIRKLDRRVQEGERKSKELKRERERASFQELKKAAGREQPQFEMQSWQTIDENKWDDLERLYSNGEENCDSEHDGNNNKNNANTNGARDNRQYESGDSEEYLELTYDCFVCNKRFKSENQLENHNNTKAHRKKIKQIQAQMKKEHFALGLEDLSDLEDYASAQSREDIEEDKEEQDQEQKENEDESEEESADEELKKLEEELAHIEKQLKGVNTGNGKDISLKDENDDYADVDVDVEVEKSDAESLPSSDKKDEEFEKVLAELEVE